VPVFTSDWLLPGPAQPAPMPADGGTDCRWPEFQFPIGADWPAGAYSAAFVEGDGQGGVNPTPTPPPPPPNANADQADVFGAFFVVRPVTPTAAVLYVIPLFTYHASNTTGGTRLYEANASQTVTFLRPGGGIGAYNRHYDVPDVYDSSSRRQTFAHWDTPFIHWLYANGIAADFCTDLDLHQDPHLADDYRLMLFVGHAEYWSQAERDAVDAFVNRGGNVAFFSGNTCWWRVEVIEGGTGLRCEKNAVPPASDWVPAQWWSNVGQPENSTTGVSYRSGGGWWDGFRDDVPYTVYHTSHWSFEGTGLKDGDTLGSGAQLVGYEADGTQMTWEQGLPRPTGIDCTPLGFTILGVGLLQDDGWQFAFKDLYPQRAATMGTYTNGGTVFNAATSDWARVLTGGAPGIRRLTRNVFDNLAQLAQLDGLKTAAGYYAAGDGFQHVIVATIDGVVHEVFWKPQDPANPGVGVDQLTTFPAGTIAALAGYYAAGDGFQHVIVATIDGVVHEVFWKPQDPANPGVGVDQLTTFPAGTIAALAGYYADATGYQHVITATTAGRLCQAVFRP
jgi:hypothetical protein